MNGDWQKLEGLAQQWRVTDHQLAEIFHVEDEHFDEMLIHPMSGEAHGILMEMSDIDHLLQGDRAIAVRTPRPDLAGRSILQVLAKRGLDPHVLQNMQHH